MKLEVRTHFSVDELSDNQKDMLRIKRVQDAKKDAKEEDELYFLTEKAEQLLRDRKA
jgi:hypothetical protein